MLVSLQKAQEEGAGCGQDDLVGFHLLTILTGQGDISKFPVLPHGSKCRDGIVLEIIPLQTQLVLLPVHGSAAWGLLGILLATAGMEFRWIWRFAAAQTDSTESESNLHHLMIYQVTRTWT